MSVREVKSHPSAAEQFAENVDLGRVSVAQALLPVRFCAPQFRIVNLTTIAKPAQARVPVLLKRPLRFASISAEFPVARMEPPPRRKLYTRGNRSDNSK
jgi:hypothetical protein